jgi:hypothetical protein
MVHAAQQNFKLHIMFPSILQQHPKFVFMCAKNNFPTFIKIQNYILLNLFPSKVIWKSNQSNVLILSN